MPTSFTYSDSSPFAVPTGNGLCARSDIEQIFGQPNVYKWSLLSNSDPYVAGGSAEITNRINWAINLASTDFRNAIRQGGYQLTPNVTGAPSLSGGSGDAIVWQTNIVAIKAGMYLYSHLRPTERGPDGRPQPSHYDGLFAYADEQLNFVRARKLRLDAAPLGRGTSGPFVTHERTQHLDGPGQIGYGPNCVPGNFPYG
jgi:hypothetical protein